MFRFPCTLIAGLCLTSGAIRAEVYTLTLKEAIERALKQNPEVIMARLDERRAAAGVRLAQDPFVPRVDVGSGLAYTNGYPQSVEGSAPSIVNAKASEYIFNRQQTYILAQARENARGSSYATASKRDDIAFRIASLYLDLDRATRLAELTGHQTESLSKVAETAKSRVEMGYELPLEEKRAIVELKRSQQRAESVGDDRDFAERSLAVVLGYSAEDHVQTAGGQSIPEATSATESSAREAALANSKDLRRLESALIAKNLEIKSDKAQRLPRVDLVAQYALFSRFNHLDEYFVKFQRNNVELGVSIAVPLLPGPGISAQVAQADAESIKIKTNYEATRNKITLDVHQAFVDLRKAQTAKDVSQADLDLAREQLSVLLSQMAEGRASLRQVEEARIGENEKWLAFYDAEYAADRARLALLRQTGEIMASLR